jgi:hypothetical protein
MKFAKIFLYGFLIWLLPFFVSVIIFPWREAERPLFESIMPVVITACVVFFSIISLKNTTSNFLLEGTMLGLAWMSISLLIDLLLFMEGPMKMAFIDYIKDIGLTYLIIPIITIGFGYLLDRCQHETS